MNVGLGIASDFPNVGVEAFDPKLKALCAGAGVEWALPNAAAVGADPPNVNPEGLEAAGVFSNDAASGFFWNGVELLEAKPP